MSDLEQARRRAARLLAQRDHSKRQLEEKLSSLHSAQVVEKVLRELDAMGVLDDEAAAMGRARTVRFQRRWGDRKIERDLRTKGIDGTIVVRVLAQVNREYPQQQCLEDVVRSRVAKTGPPRAKARLRSLFQFLLRRGFDAESVRRVLEPFTKKEYPQ